MSCNAPADLATLMDGIAGGLGLGGKRGTRDGGGLCFILMLGHCRGVVCIRCRSCDPHLFSVPFDEAENGLGIEGSEREWDGT